ncbi:ETS-related transcription factor Elf-5-like isoform X2 [Hydractinia symbiolongicarpus]|nr:ETS-related transcription factor Elf-5-like isoform X2 [Hydractinia symbiolongicarpus]
MNVATNHYWNYLTALHNDYVNAHQLIQAVQQQMQSHLLTGQMLERRQHRRMMDPLRPYPQFYSDCHSEGDENDDPFNNLPSPQMEDLISMDFSDLFQPENQTDSYEELKQIMEQVRRESTDCLFESEVTPVNMRNTTEENQFQTESKVRLYEFVLQLLNEESTDCVRWLCPKEGEFEITNSSKIASLWGKVKKNPNMTYEKFARALRHYYKLGILINYKHKEKLRYKFSKEILLKNKVGQ